jgi:uracil-DNA glycosylase family 4
MSDLSLIIDETIKALEEFKRSGVTHIEVSRETLEQLGSRKASRDVTRPASDNAGEIKRLEADAKKCVKCAELSRCRHSVVFGVGNVRAEVMFIGEAPGADEDAQGEPFVGRAGQLLTKIIEAMGYTREDVYITNIIKCRPPQNRTPLPDEVTNCLPYVLRQIELIQPKVIVALGATALRALLDVQLGITKMRGHWYTFHDIPIMPTFHPAYLLRNPAAKREVWDDMKAVLDKLGRKVPRG